jgi:hypothetical protein
MTLAFLENNLEQYAMDAAAGHGETIETLAGILNMDSDKWAKSLNRILLICLPMKMPCFGRNLETVYSCSSLVLLRIIKKVRNPGQRYLFLGFRAFFCFWCHENTDWKIRALLLGLLCWPGQASAADFAGSDEWLAVGHYQPKFLAAMKARLILRLFSQPAGQA